MYDFLDLRLVQFMSEEASLTAVASRARMSLPAVSQRLSKLEEHFNVKLVNRSGKFGLTPAGQLLFRAAANINAEIADAERGIAVLQAKSLARLTISCSSSTAIDDLPLVLDRLGTDMPELRITLQEIAHGKLVDQLTEGSVDVALLDKDHNAPGIEITPYRTERACVVVPLSHPLAQRPGPVLFADTLCYDFVVVSAGSRQRDLISEITKRSGSAPKIRATVQSIEALSVLIGQTHLGIGLTFETAARRHERTQPIQVIRLADPWATQKLFAWTKPLHEASPTTQWFIHLLQERFRPKLGEHSRQFPPKP